MYSDGLVEVFRRVGLRIVGFRIVGLCILMFISDGLFMVSGCGVCGLVLS